MWFVGADAALTTEVEFPRLVKPVLQNPYSEPFSIRVLDRGCRIEALHLNAGGMACFVGLEIRDPSLTVLPSLSAPLYRAGIRRAGGDRTLGTLERGAVVPEDGTASGNPPPDPDLRSFSRFLSEPCLYGWLERRERASTGAASPDLDVPPRLRPRLFVARNP